jgi:hypothetical protein
MHPTFPLSSETHDVGAGTADAAPRTSMSRSHRQPSMCRVVGRYLTAPTSQPGVSHLLPIDVSLFIADERVARGTALRALPCGSRSKNE